MSHSEGRRRYGDSPKTPPTPTMEQLLQGDASWWPPSTSPTTRSPRSARDYDPEEDHTLHQKKSVLTKVKERAKKLRHSLSKKRSGTDGNTTPAWGVSLDDEDDDEEDPEYFGAPMYESELAPEGYKETARHHPRASPTVPQNHMLATNAKHNTEQDSMMTVEQNTDQAKQKPTTPNKKLTETMTEKFAPAYATVSQATHAIASKIQSLALSSPRESTIGECGGGNSEQKWDKGVSVKEYFMHKFEPGDDERALSHAISEALSPRKGPGDTGVVEKVREAISSLLRAEESVSSTKNTNTTTVTTTTTKSSSAIPISTNAHEVTEEENHGRILQTN